MKHLLYTLSIVLFLAPFALAQGAEKKEEAITPEQRARKLQELGKLLGSDDPVVRQKAFEEIRRLGEVKRKAAPDGWVQLEFSSPTINEKIKGNWSKDGTKGEYTLESLGKGRYKLTARSVDGDGTESKYEDEGSMAALRKKYPFLAKFGGMVLIGPGGTPGTARKGGLATTSFPFTTYTAPSKLALAAPKAVPALGISVRRPSKELEYHLKLPTETTWIVEAVTPGAKGEKLGLKRYDLITGVDGEDLAELKPLLVAKDNLSIIRRSKPRRVSLVADQK